MSIASRITAMEEHISNAYDKIEDLGIDLTDVDKNINNISSMLENVWEEYPKVSASDVEEASLNGTKKGRINIDLKGNTEQDGEPTPENPVPIKNVTGNANVKIQNKNLFDSSNLINWYVNYSEPSGYSSNVYCGINQFFKLKPNTSYTISTKQNVKRLFMPLYDKDYNILRQTVIIDGKQVTFTTNSNEQYAKVCFSLDGTTAMEPNNYKEFIQLEQGSTATSYVEHQEQNYPFTFSEGQRAMEGTTLQDDGIHNNRKRVNLWEQTTYIGRPFGNYYRYQIDISDAKTYSTNDGSTALCNCFYMDIDALTSAIAKVGMFAQYRDTQGFYFISDKSTTTEFIAELTENNAVLEYELAEEEIIPYNETQQAQYNAIKNAKSYDEQTNISSTSDEIGAVVKASAMGDLNLILTTMQSKIDLLEG